MSFKLINATCNEILILFLYEVEKFQMSQRPFFLSAMAECIPHKKNDNENVVTSNYYVVREVRETVCDQLFMCTWLLDPIRRLDLL